MSEDRAQVFSAALVRAEKVALQVDFHVLLSPVRCPLNRVACLEDEGRRRKRKGRERVRKRIRVFLTKLRYEIRASSKFPELKEILARNSKSKSLFVTAS